ncbi:MAG: ATP-dependent DNA helicase [Firmicutes bacterium]|nr:ATP-dependent DNA helicase [Bacillota bacterium]
MDKPVVTAPVRAVVEFALLSGDLLPGSQLSRMRDGMLGHQARQASLPDAATEVPVRGRAEGERVTLEVSGRIDALYERDGQTVIEEIKLCPAGGAPEGPAEEHRAQAVCYGHMLGKGAAIIRVAYVEQGGAEVVSFEEWLDAEALCQAFLAFTRPYLAMVEERAAWRAVRDASILPLAFPYGGYRAGQRDMAAQSYWAIKLKKRLFVQAPTGIGKTAAALFPALKALGEGLTGQIFYLTARTTAGKNATAAIKRMRESGLRLRALTLTAKEKVCGGRGTRGESDFAAWRCDMLTCPYALGFFDRLPAALADMRAQDDWSREVVEQAAGRHRVCPFEFSLSLCEEADAVICDYNYAFDPASRVRRVFQRTTNLTLLVDESHNLPDRARDMLSAVLDSEPLREIRRAAGKALGRRAPVYRHLTGLIRWMDSQAAGASPVPPDALRPLLTLLTDASLAVVRETPLGDLPRILAAAIATLERFDERYVMMTEREGGRTRVTLYCLDPAPHLHEAVRKLRGAVFFSATLTPLPAWRDALGGTEEDALLSLPSPFPRENLLVLRYAVSTRYRVRERTAEAVAEAIAAMAEARPGNYLACFPSYAYLRRVKEAVEARAPHVVTHAQWGGMDDAAREKYLSVFQPRAAGALLGMVVLGGVFGEGVDLPGDRLSGVAVVGVGLPQVCLARELLRGYYARTLGDGFAHAYRYPGMNKVLQAVGRVIRTETDQGVALLIDDRFLAGEYTALMPSWWGAAEAAGSAEGIARRARLFWRGAEGVKMQF